MARQAGGWPPCSCPLPGRGRHRAVGAGCCHCQAPGEDCPTRGRDGSRAEGADGQPHLVTLQLAGTDLGVSFRHKGRTYLLFGDTIGPPGGDAFAWTTDDNPEDGLDLTFLDDGNGTYRPLTIPGISQRDFEVPMEGTSVGGRMYVYHTTNHSETVPMGRSVVAVSEDDGKSFRYLYDLSHQHFINVSVVEVKAQDWKGVPQRRGDGLFLFGSRVVGVF